MVAQLEVTEAIIDEHFQGDALALAPVLADDVRSAAGRMSLFVVRQMGVRRLLQLAPKTHAQLYDVGDLTSELDDRSATLSFTGSVLFEHPTWRLLQLFATETMLALAGQDGECRAHPSDEPGTFRLDVFW